MATRITRKQLDTVADCINNTVGTPTEYMTDGVINTGHYTVSGCYGGYSLHQICNESGGCRDVFSVGHVSARELMGLMRAFLTGYVASTK